jgi:hypothetical protein
MEPGGVDGRPSFAGRIDLRQRFIFQDFQKRRHSCIAQVEDVSAQLLRKSLTGVDKLPHKRSSAVCVDPGHCLPPSHSHLPDQCLCAKWSFALRAARVDSDDVFPKTHRW